MRDDFQECDLGAAFQPPLDVPLMTAAEIDVSILTLANRFNFCVDSENEGLGQELFQTFRLRDGRPFALNFLVHSGLQDGHTTQVNVRRDPATQRQDVRDVLKALDLPESCIRQEFPLPARP